MSGCHRPTQAIACTWAQHQAPRVLASHCSRVFQHHSSFPLQVTVEPTELGEGMRVRGQQLLCTLSDPQQLRL